MGRTKFHSDEPSHKDLLQRSTYAKALAQVGLSAETPLVIGLYGRWGVGKTTLLQLIEAELRNTGDVATVHFDAWRHQFDEHPALALLHTMADQLGRKSHAPVKKVLSALARAFGSIALRATTPLEVDDVEKGLQAYEEQNFLVRDAQARLRQHFSEVVDEVRGDKRLVFFIDDLDRCLSEHILKVLEALKLYLNIPGCIYFLAVDRSALESSIRHHYGDDEIDEVSYLDKIVQLPFEIPPLEPANLTGYINSLLPGELKVCSEILQQGLAGNPRAVKRFVNTLQLNNHLAGDTMQSTKPEILADLLLVQYHSTGLYAEIARRPELLKALNGASSVSETFAKEIEVLKDVLSRLAAVPTEELIPYVYLTAVARIAPEQAVDDAGFFTESGLADLLVGEEVLERLLIFQTAKQHTWLVSTPGRIHCILDDSKTREAKRLVQWQVPVKHFDNVQIRAYQSERGNWVIDLGRRAPWLYSRALFSTPEKLVDRVNGMIQRARIGEGEF